MQSAFLAGREALIMNYDSGGVFLAGAVCECMVCMCACVCACVCVCVCV